MNRLSNNMTKTCKCLSMLHSDSSKSTVSFEYQRKDILIET